MKKRNQRIRKIHNTQMITKPWGRGYSVVNLHNAFVIILQLGIKITTCFCTIY